MDLLFLLRAPNHRGYEVFDRRRADLLHGDAKLDAQQLEHTLDAGLAERAEPPEIRPADAHALRAHRQGLDDVGAAAKAAVDEHRDAPAHGLEHLRKRVDGGAAAVFAAPAVVGNDDPVEAVVGGELRILVGEQALDEDPHPGGIAQPLEEVPGHGGRRRDARDIGALVHDSAPEVRLRRTAVMAAPPFARVAQLETGLRVLDAVAHDVHGDGHRWAARLLPPPPEGPCDLPVFP